MGMITDIIKGLPLTAIQDEKIKQHEKRLTELEAENKELKERLSKYESQSGEKCPMCRKPTLSLTSSKPNQIFGETGLSDYQFSCPECGFSDVVSEDSAGRAWQKMRGH